MDNNSLDQQNFQNHHQHHSPHISPIHQQTHSHQISPQFNQQSQKPRVNQASPSITHPPQYNPHIPPAYFQQYPTNSPSMDNNESLLTRGFHRQMDMTE